MNINYNKTAEFLVLATSTLVSTALHAGLDITLSSGTDTNKIYIGNGQVAVVEYKIQDLIGTPPARTWLWRSPIPAYISRAPSIHQPDCAIYMPAGGNPNSFALPPNGTCYFAMQVDGTLYATIEQGKPATYRPVFSNRAVAYGPCPAEQVYLTQASSTSTIVPLIAGGSYCDTTLIRRPLLAFSQNVLTLSPNSSSIWSYPESITEPQFTPSNINSFTDFGAFNGTSCDGTLCIAVGGYNDEPTRPLLALSKDSGNNWSYPDEINAPKFTPSDTYQYIDDGNFAAASCSGSTCIATGSYKDASDITRPLLALSQNSGATWSYPESITVPEFDDYPFANGGSLISASCSGSTCIAAGAYSDAVFGRHPLLALSQNSGSLWTYPESITTPVFTPNDAYPVDPTANDIGFYAASCTSGMCIAAGYYTDMSAVLRPLLALSQNSGSSWSFPESITAPRLTLHPFSGDGVFHGASCSGSTCIAAGRYDDTAATGRPLLAVSQDSGSTWTYPGSITNPVFNANPYGDFGGFNSASCFASTCIAVGYYSDINAIMRPLLAVSQDSGNTWKYPESITTPTFTPEDTYPFMKEGSLDSVSCSGSTCFAVGSYGFGSTDTMRPLLAVSQDSGSSWSYPTSITVPAFIPNTYPFGDADFGGYLAGSSTSSASFLPRSLKFIVQKSRERPSSRSFSRSLLAQPCGMD